MIYIYALLDPDTREIRYIGKSIRPRERLGSHVNERGSSWRHHWLDALKKENKKPSLMILQEMADGSDWKYAEKWWIHVGRYMWRLTNCTDGGDGVENLTGPGRERMLAASIGRKASDETKALMSRNRKGRRHTEEHKERMRQKMTGRVFTAQWLQKISESNSKLNDEDVREARRLIAEGYSYKNIGKRLGVSSSCIRFIHLGRFYAHVLDDPDNPPRRLL